MLWACQTIAAQYIPRQFSPFATEARQFKLSSPTADAAKGRPLFVYLRTPNDNPAAGSSPSASRSRVTTMTN